MIVLDANVWISSLLAQDVNHSLSALWLNRAVLAGEAVIAPSVFVPEVAATLAMRTGNPVDAAVAAHSILSGSMIELVPVDLDLAESAANIAVALSLRGADSVYVALAVRRSLKLVTWDKELLTRAGSVADVQQPF